MNFFIKGNKIVGIGVDIIEVKRIRSAILKNKNFLTKVFSDKEVSYCMSKKNLDARYICFAQRFSAKEAVLKAFGLGGFNKIKLNEIEILNKNNGKPTVNLIGNAAIFAKENKLVNIEISLSGVKKYAVAFAIVFGNV